MKPGFFITGTSTGVGKSYVAALIARSLVESGRFVGVYKPVASGCRREGKSLISEDAELLWEAAGRPGTLEEVCPQLFEAPLAPPIAAAREGSEVDTDLLRTGLDIWQERSDLLLVEGAGGLMSPLTEDQYNADLAVDLGLPLIVVAANELGTINATLQTIITARAVAPDLPIAGVILNQTAPLAGDESLISNAEELARRLEVPLLASLPFRASELPSGIDWLALARGTR